MIWMHSKMKHLGYYSTQEEAARAYERAAKEYKTQFGSLPGSSAGSLGVPSFGGGGRSSGSPFSGSSKNDEERTASSSGGGGMSSNEALATDGSQEKQVKRKGSLGKRRMSYDTMRFEGV